jgi:hypothetical protein
VLALFVTISGLPAWRKRPPAAIGRLKGASSFPPGGLFGTPTCAAQRQNRGQANAPELPMQRERHTAALRTQPDLTRLPITLRAAWISVVGGIIKKL